MTRHDPAASKLSGFLQYILGEERVTEDGVVQTLVSQHRKRTPVLPVSGSCSAGEIPPIYLLVLYQILHDAEIQQPNGRVLVERMSEGCQHAVLRTQRQHHIIEWRSPIDSGPRRIRIYECGTPKHPAVEMDSR